MISRVTVAICTHNRARFLDACLGSLLIAMKEHDFSVLVVANCCKDDTDEVVAKYKDSLQVRMVSEDALGLSHARNCAIANAASRYIVYLDDDAMPLPSWCDAIEKIVNDVEPDIFGGPYYPYYLESKPSWFDDDFGSAHQGVLDGFLSQGEYLSGGNMGWRVDLLKEIGGFSPDLGMTGSMLSLGEETAIQARLEQEFRIRGYFATDMCMLHYVHPVKMSLRYIAKRSYVYGYLLEDINPLDECLLNSGIIKSIADTKLGFPLLFRLFIRDRAKYRFWKTYAARFLSLHMIAIGVVARKLVGT